MMDHDRFAALAEAYGADIRAWPEAERDAARAYAAAAPERAEAVLGDAAVLDQALAHAAPIEPPPGLEAAILAGAPSNPAAPAPGLAGLAAALALMIGAGAGWFAAPAGDPYADPVFAEAFGALEGAETLEDFSAEEAS